MINTWMVTHMKIGKAQQIYREQVKEYQKQKSILSKQLKATKSRMESTQNDTEKAMFSKDAAVLELSIKELDDKQKEYQDYLDELTEQYCAYFNMEASKQQADAAKEYAIEMGKIMEVARRIMKGGTVPAADEKKLMDFSYELYQAAKSVGEMVKRQKEKDEEYDTLWGKKEEKEYNDPDEVAGNATAASEGPKIVSAGDTLAGVFVSEE